MKHWLLLIPIALLVAPLGAADSELRSKDSYHPFRQVDSAEAWETRAASLRRQVLVATGLWPMPTRHPLHAVVHGLVDRDDYTVEKVSFESFPGHYVSGSLYRPKNLKRGQKIPGILSPHGHWTNGRYHDHGTKFAKELETGGEQFPSGRHPLQARCVQLARMGCVVFHYDMVGYADSIQLDHRKSSMPENGLFSVTAELRQQNLMGIQTFNSIRALDFLEGLPGIDQDRIGVTGASGGGTQTFILGAVDDRPDLLFPAVMVSTAMQGGCVCENANYLRVGAGNIDLAALTAPRPLGITGADDWTIEIETKGKPELEQLYSMLGKRSHFDVFPFLRFKHNFNAVSRQAMYGFVNTHFKLGHELPIREQPFTPLSKREMGVWTTAHPAPSERGASHEEALLKWWATDSDLQLATLRSRMGDNAQAAADYVNLVGGAWETMIGRSWDEVGPVSHELTLKEEVTDYLLMEGTMESKAHNESVLVRYIYSEGWNGEVILRWASADEVETFPNSATLIQDGFALVTITDDVSKAAMNQPEASGYTFGYNATTFARRVHDMLTVVKGMREMSDDWEVSKVHLQGNEGGAAIALATRFLLRAQPFIGESNVSLGGMRFANVTRLDDPWFVPGVVKYGDIESLILLNQSF